MADKTNELEVLKQIYAAINRNDIPAVMQFFDPDIERVEFVELPMGVTIHGHEKVKTHFLKARETWSEGSCEPEEFIPAGDRYVVFVHVRVRKKNAQEWTQGRIADVFTFRDGKVIHMRSFADREQALSWAGVSKER